MLLRCGTQILLTSLLLASPTRAQQDFSQVEIKAVPVATNLYMLQGAGGNIGVSVGPDGILMIDDQFAPLAERISAALHRLDPGPLRYLINTHHHGDHTGGNAYFGKQAQIVAHENVRKRLGGSSAGPSAPGLPVVTFPDHLTVYFNDEEIRIIHLPPGHTDGDSYIHFTRANVFHMGDSFFSGRFPNIDLGGGGDVRGYIRNVEATLRMAPPGAKFIPGHGPLSTVKEVKELHEMLVETSGIVERAIAAGKTLEQIKADGLPDKWKSWAVPTMTTERWLELLYRGLSRQ
ncbi:MAG TPA: MBL fold metallo-hydrolase [Candidatus Saccharimonadales bacterium]|nr:MBL fold metallo-hydrolase [Candidatus Saccharimonadales bacterium]